MAEIFLIGSVPIHRSHRCSLFYEETQSIHYGATLAAEICCHKWIPVVMWEANSDIFRNCMMRYFCQSVEWTVHIRGSSYRSQLQFRQKRRAVSLETSLRVYLQNYCASPLFSLAVKTHFYHCFFGRRIHYILQHCSKPSPGRNPLDFYLRMIWCASIASLYFGCCKPCREKS